VTASAMDVAIDRESVAANTQAPEPDIRIAEA
jgi:hypothetical protein